MKLKTSFFNIGVFRKNLLRFAPLWVLYAVAEVLGLMTIDSATYGRIAGDMNDIMGPVAICHGIYALIVAACLFGDLFDARLCNGLHAMPMRREGWLLTNVVSGLTFALIPAIVGGTVGAVMLGDAYWMALLWQATSLLQFVFFFGLAVFSAMCAGKRIGMIAIYIIFNFLSLLILWVATLIYEPLLPGVVISDDWFNLLCPVASIATDNYVNFRYDRAAGGFESFNPEAWQYLYICVGVGVVLLLLSWLLYRRRHLETAGDFISFRPMRIFFLLAYTFAVGALLYSFGDLFGLYKDYGFLVVGILVGWFTGWMLLERTVKIFNKKSLIGFAVFAVLFAGSIGLTVMDPAGVVSYVPQDGDIKNVCLYPTQDTYIYYSTAYEGGWYITDPAEVTEVQDLHRQMIEAQDDPGGEIINMELRYELKNGRHVYRSYDVPAESSAADALRKFLSDPRAAFAVNDWQLVKNRVDAVTVYPTGDGMNMLEIYDPEQVQALLTAIEADCKEGNFAQHDYFHMDQEYMAGMDITWKVVKSTNTGVVTRGEYVTVYKDSVNTCAFLETLLEKP